MRIKRLEIVGFKSFCDRTVLRFDDPITGVVGPNGCGKSNVVDAIRWCMGEQSAKYLRGKAMEDIIFAGSDSRGPAGMAEVSLTFENDGRVPVEFLQYSEITVTRRLHRDGESEYLLNNTPCRLRDITDFFLGTGIGAKAYSIIEQGKVGAIVSSKPEDRRFFIEEAAGITKYKLKKKAAEKKMESTRQNLLRVSDVVTEIEKQLGSLRRQAQKAERYKQYKAEVRDIELWSSSQKWLGIEVEGRVKVALLDERRDARGAAETALATREASIAAARLESAEEERRLSQLQERLYELDNRIKLAEAESEHEAREAKDLEARGVSARAEIETLGRQLDEAVVERDRLALELSRVEEARADELAELEERELRHRAVKDELGRVQKDLDGAKGEIARAQAEIARGEAQERAHAKRVEDLDLRLARVVDEDARLASRGEELAREVAAHEDKLAALKSEQTRLVAERETHEERLAEIKELVQRGDKELDQLRGELHKRRSRHHSLEEIHRRYEGFARGTRAVMQKKSGEWGVRGLVADVIEAPAEYEAAVEAALGDKLGSIVVDTLEVGLDAIEFLKQEKQGRSSFVPLKARGPLLPELDPEDPQDGVRARMRELVKCDEDYRGLADALLGDVIVVEDVITAMDRWRAGERRRMVTVDGEVVDGMGVLAGGSRDAQGAGVLQQKRELRELEELVAKLEEDFRRKESELEALKAERQELEQALDNLRRDRHQGEMNILTVDKDLHRLREEQARLASRAGTLSGDREDLSRQRAEALREAEELRAVVRGARDRMGAAEEQRDHLGRTAVGLIDRVEEAAAELTEFKVLAAKAEEKRATLAVSKKRVEALIADGDGRRERLERAITDGIERVARLRAAIEERSRELVGWVAESRTKSDELHAGRTAYESKMGGLLEAEAEIKSLRAALQAETQAVADLELELRELALNRTHLEEQIEERWRLRLVDVLIDYHLRPPVTDAEEKRLRELRDLIDRMGEINLTAIDEYNALEQRYNFLVSQRSDLESALKQLEEAIAQINKASRKRFREVFDLVNAKFQELFPRLFRGGHAHLKLIAPTVPEGQPKPDEEDILESGIEIVAQPPGKKNTTIELLSGGEKALTAVSLIFSIFLIKPSPFCLLDEVDAPLDEANVGRFNDLVRSMTDRSQFIIITHNKRTMEIADTLYGVTMEQPGCSKLVSVNLTTAGRQAA